MDFKYNLEETLIHRFDDKDELMDIVEHGPDTGVSDFTYTYEINEFYNEFDDDIENYFYEVFGDAWLKDTGAADCCSLDEVRCHLVWMFLSHWCETRLEEMEVEMLNEMSDEEFSVV